MLFFFVFFFFVYFVCCLCLFSCFVVYMSVFFVSFYCCFIDFRFLLSMLLIIFFYSDVPKRLYLPATARLHLVWLEGGGVMLERVTVHVISCMVRVRVSRGGTREHIA